MKFLGKLMRKPVAILVAVMLITGSVSVAFAAGVGDYSGDGTADFDVKWSVLKDGQYVDAYDDKDGAYIEYAAAGDSVKADVYLTTDFKVGNITVFFALDPKSASGILTFDTAKYQYYTGSGATILYVAESPFGNTGSVGPRSGFLKSHPDLSESGGLDGVYARISGLNHQYVAGDKAILTFYYTVSQTVSIDSVARIPVYIPYILNANSSDDDLDYCNGNMAYIDEQDKSTDSIDWNLTVTGTAETLAFAGDVKFSAVDAQYGKIGNDITVTKNGIIGNPVVSDDVPTVTATADYTFVGWSTETYSGTDAQTDAGVEYFGGDYSKLVENFNNVTYKAASEADTYYAVYKHADTTYDIIVYTNTLVDGNPSGTYAEYAKLEDQSGTVGDTVTADAASSIIPAAGYELNTTKSDASITLTSTADNNVLKLYYDPIKYTITWVLDGSTDPINTEDMYYGTDTGKTVHPDPDVVYLDPAKDNFGYRVDPDTGWTPHEGTASSDITVTGTLSPLTVEVRYHATDSNGDFTGSFDSGNAQETANKEYAGSFSLSELPELTPPEGMSLVKVEYKDPNNQLEAKVAPPATLDNTNYHFDLDGETLIVDIYPVFEWNTGTVKFDANDGEFADNVTVKTDSYTYNDPVTVYGDADLVVKKQGTDDSSQPHDFTFKGWALSTAPDTVVDVPAIYKEDASYIAVWEDEAKTIEFKDKDGNTVYTIKRNLDDSGKYELTGDDYPPAGTIPVNDGEEWVWNPGSTTITGDTPISGYFLYDLVYTYVDTQGNTQTSPVQKLKEGDPIPGLAIDDETGWSFDGWYTDDGYTTKFADYNEISSRTMPANSLKLYGHYVPNKYKVNYVVDGEPYELNGKTYDEYEYKAPITLRDEPTKEGNTFSGWSNAPANMPATDITVSGTFTPNKYRIVYVKPDGTLESVIEEDFGTDLSGTTAPDYEQYNNVPGAAVTYTGWSMQLPATMPVYSDEFDVDGTHYTNAVKVTPVSQDNEKVKVTYIFADGTEAASLEDYPGAALTAPANSVEDGYDFAWDQTLTQFPASDTTVNETKTPKDVSYTVDPGDGSTPINGTTPFDEKIDKPADPTPADGTDFEGWFLPDGTPFDFDKPIKDQIPYGDGTVAIKARYSVSDTYYIATGVDSTTGEFNYTALETHKHFTDVADETYTVPEIPAMEGFTTKGWSLDKENVVTPDGTWAATSRDFYALYEIKNHTVTYMVDGEQYEQFTVPFAGEVKRPAEDPTKEGFTFAGWLDDQNNAPGNYATMPDKDLVFTAQWTPIVVDDVTITLYDRDGNIYRTITGKPGDPIPDSVIPPDPSRFGYRFVGWDPEIPTTIPDEDIEINAVWERDVNFVPIVIGGVVVSGIVIGSIAAANTAIATGAIIGGTALVVGGIVIAKHTHKVTYLVDGEVYRVFYIIEGAKVIVPKAPTKDGATFNGWDPEVADRMPDHDLTYNATWCAGDSDSAPVDSVIPDTGSAAASLAAFAVIAGTAAAAFVITKKKKDEE